jgi:hypothetical protein
VDGRHSTEEHETHIKPAAAWWLSPPLYRFLCPSPSLSRQSGGRFLLIAGTSLQQPGHETAADQHCQQTVTPYIVRPPTVSCPVLSCLVCIPVGVRMCMVHGACGEWRQRVLYVHSCQFHYLRLSGVLSSGLV